MLNKDFQLNILKAENCLLTTYPTHCNILL